MHAQPPSSDQARSKYRRVQNEFRTKDINESKVDHVNEFRDIPNKSSHTLMSFKCECDNETCQETIQMSTEEYEHVHRNSRKFVVIPEHVSLDIEKVVAAFSGFVIVEKFSSLA